MKKIILIAACVASSFAFAQTRKTTNPSFAPMQTNYSYDQNNLTALLGFASGAANIGVDYARMSDGSGFGGYFFMQTDKKAAGVKQVLSFGGLMKFNVVDRNKFTAFMSPGFGIHMLKEASFNASTGALSDETAFGAVFKIGAQYKLTPEFALGIESTTLTNMFNDKVAAGVEFYSFAGSFNF